MKNKLYKGVVIILCIFIVFNISLIVDDAIYFFTEPEADIDYLLYSVNYNDYLDLDRQLSKFTQEEIDANETLGELYHVSEYFNNATIYKAYKDNDTEKAEKYKAKLDFHLENMGLLAYTADEINTLLDL